MESHPRISELLLETGAFTDKEPPVILASGVIGIYYINTEKLMQDKGQWKNYKTSSQEMINHACKMAAEHSSFQDVIDILAEQASGLLKLPSPDALIAGGQTRDWIFSGPVARQLGVPHISIYKDGAMEGITPSGSRVAVTTYLENRDALALPIVDLITNGSSIYRMEDGKTKGWIPSVRGDYNPGFGATVHDAMAVVDRLQGGPGSGRELMVNDKIGLHSQVFIDEDFLGDNSKDPARALDYKKDPDAWGENYIRNNGIEAFVCDFDPAGGDRLKKGKAFLAEYGHVLQESGRMAELDKAVQDKYNKHLVEIMSVV